MPLLDLAAHNSRPQQVWAATQDVDTAPATAHGRQEAGGGEGGDASGDIDDEDSSPPALSPVRPVWTSAPATRTCTSTAASAAVATGEDAAVGAEGDEQAGLGRSKRELSGAEER
ncbi:hypothetical protein GCM10010104_23610 [Streptomyces indiaensis]|uniref:Uncharacterized protein n=1 Tax=Streptomyces indiaensis TaxID=284033 RepID=A0ABN3DFP2_9ACTN